MSGDSTVPASQEQPESALTLEQLEQVLEVAVRAPSLHNTQPWRFQLRGDVLEVRADRSRQLPLQDPLGRELVLSCGGAAVHAQLAVRGLGLACDLDWTPQPDDPDHVASLSVSSPDPVTPDELRLLEATALRHTDRTAFAPTPVPAALVVALSDAAQVDGAHLAAEQEADRVLAIDVLVARADRIQRAEPGQRAELSAWVRPGPHPSEGVPGGALPDHGLAAAPR